MRKRLLWLALAVALMLAVGATPAFANLSGAIFTTVADGSRVNANIYPAKTAVYLDGGPGINAPASAAALPEGWYVFQVTDPSGKTLLSEDPVWCRQFYVSSAGVITDVRGGIWTVKGKSNYFEHNTGVDKDHAELGAITVQLMPYKDTPNPGGVYKVWAMRFDDFVAVNGAGALSKVDPGGTRFHGFVPSMSKTDNYKVKGKPEQRLIVKKFCDTNANGVWDEGENEICGWPLKIIEPSTVEWDPAFTRVDIISQLTGKWAIWEYEKPIGDQRQWVQTALYVDGVKQSSTLGPVFVDYGTCDGEVHTVVFGNVPLGEIVAHKFHDKNCNGKQDADEENVGGFEFTLEGCGPWGTYKKVLTTNAGGDAVFSGLMPGTYKLTETSKSEWGPTTPVEIANIDLKTCSMTPVKLVYSFGNVKYVKICAFKFLDADGDGKYDEGDSAKPDWQFTLTGTDMMGNSVNYSGSTDADGKVCWDLSYKLYPGDYVVAELIPADSKWAPSALWTVVDGGEPVVKAPAVSVEIPAGAGEVWDATFGNCEPGCIEAIKLQDDDADGVGDRPKAGWEITLTGTTNKGDAVSITKHTDADGKVKFCDVWPGTYKLEEEERGGWRPMGPTSYDGIVIVSGGSDSRTFVNCQETEFKVCKFKDLDGDGKLELDEPKVPGITIHLTGGPAGYTVDKTLKTDEDGRAMFTDLMPGTYYVEEILPEGWKATAMYYDVGDGLDLRSGTIAAPQAVALKSGVPGKAAYFNTKPGCIEVEKFYDADADGEKDADEQWLKGIKVVLTGTENIDGDGDGSTTVEKTAYTDENGKAKFCGLWPGEYTVKEVLPADDGTCVWKATTDSSYGPMKLSACETEGPYRFGNVCIKKAGFRTKGFWHNKNGTDLITSGDIAALNALEPFATDTAWWDMGFDGTWVKTGNTYFGDGAVGEISDFITASESRDPIPQRMQLIQQLCAFVLNVRHFGGGMDSVLTLGDGTAWKASDLVDEAVAAWESGDANWCSSVQSTITKYNESEGTNGKWVMIVMSTPCEIKY